MSVSASAKQLADATTHSSRYVRSACVVALRRLRNANAAEFLRDADPWVAKEAAAAIHDDFSIPSALPQLAGLLDDPGQLSEEGPSSDEPSVPTFDLALHVTPTD